MYISMYVEPMYDKADCLQIQTCVDENCQGGNSVLRKHRVTSQGL